LVKRLLRLSCGIFGIALVFAAPAAAYPVISISEQPKTGARNPVTFTGPAGATDYFWDLNGDGDFGDRVGPTAKWAYDLPGTVSVGLRYTDTEPREVVEQFHIDGLSPTFIVFPVSPLPGQAVSFVYSGGPAVPTPPEWDLDGDGRFPDATGPNVSRTFPAPGTYLVGLRVTDVDEAVSTGFQSITVGSLAGPAGGVSRPPQPRLMSPFPVVRITGKVGKRGARIKRLTIRAPFGATIRVRCRGRGCPFRRTSRTLALAGKKKTPSTTIRIKRFERRLLRGGASVKVLVSRQGEVGKYTRFLIRRGKPPQRTDLCLVPSTAEPVECPSS
jgi:hypothetical protein